jgi:DNA (cytosine-5)-methyltransferase 1
VRTVIDLFSGIGGFSYGFEATGEFSTVVFVENNDFCQRILQKHWPDIPIYGDIKELSFTGVQADVVVGGFPCQDVSIAAQGDKRSILGDRSGLWTEYRRVIKEVRPNWVVIENVAALQNRGLIQILRQLTELGYDAEWHIIPAHSVGFPHTRKRIWIIAHSNRHRVERDCPFPLQGLSRLSRGQNMRGFAEFWRGPALHAPRLCRSPYGIPNGVDRLRGIGNSIVPQIAAVIAQSIVDWEEAE